MYTLFLITFIINAIVFVFAFISDMNWIKATHFFQRTKIAGEEIGDKIQTKYEEQDSKAKKGGYIFGIIIAFIILILGYSAFLIVPIIIGLKRGIGDAFVVYFIFQMVYVGRNLVRYGSSANYSPTKMVLKSLVGIFFFQVMTIILFGFRFSLDNILQTLYTSDYPWNNTLTLLYPIFLMVSNFTSLYLYYFGIWYKTDDPKRMKYKPKLSHFFLVVVLSSFLALIYIIESDFDFIDMSSGSPFDKITNLFMLLLASILIPVLFNLLTSKKNQEKTPAVISTIEDTTEKSHEVS